MKKIISIIILCVFSVQHVFAAMGDAWHLNGVDIIPRSERGADESWRYSSQETFQNYVAQQKKRNADFEALKTSDPDEYARRKAVIDSSNEITNARNSYLLKNYKDRVTVDKTVKESNGEDLRWAESYTDVKK